VSVTDAAEIWLQEQGEDAGLLRLALSAFQGPVLGVAVSGGSDSLALLHLAAQLAPVLGATVRAT
jgi:tRNA(Ile)-lysidine synthase TilS/MesJ